MPGCDSAIRSAATRPFVGVRRRHADVGDDHVRPVAVDLGEQRLGVRGRRLDFDAALAQHGGDAVADDRRVVGDHHRHAADDSSSHSDRDDRVAAAQPAQLDLALVVEPDVVADLGVGAGELDHHAGGEDLAAAGEIARCARP